MFRKLLPIYAVAAFAASALLPSPIQAQDRVKMNAAWVYLFGAPTNCEYITTSVSVYETWQRPRNERGGMEHKTTLHFRGIGYNHCEDLLTLYIEESVEIPASAFRFQGLKSATLQVAIDFRDEVEGTIVPVIFDMDLTCFKGSQEGNHPNGYCVPRVSGSLLLRGRNLVDSAADSESQLSRYSS